MSDVHRESGRESGREPVRGRILLVDDEAEILTALQDLLEDEYEILATTSPRRGLEMLAEGAEVSVILSDQRMPGMTGDVFLARAREVTQAEALLLTGYAELDAVVAALNNGRIAGYLPKPWEPAALRGMVAGAHRRWVLARALETERALLRGLLDHSPDLLSFKDGNGRFVRLNAAKARDIGAPAPEAALGRAEEAFLPPARAEATAAADRVALGAAFGAALGTAREAPPPREVLERRGEEEATARWYRVARIPIDCEGGPFLATIERDVTEERRLEAQLRQADKMQALGTMAGGVAHDFNNLLTAILGSLQLAQRRAGENPPLTRLLRNATLAAERGSALTRRLLTFSRKHELALRSVDVNALVLGMGDLVARTLGGTVEVRRELGEDLPPALVDPGQLELALLNLCINARDAMPDGGAVTLITGQRRVAAGEHPDLEPGAYVTLSVRDAGTGMTPEILARVFEPFFTTKDVGKGTGLGLPMVYGLTRQAGGTVQIESEPGRGTLVRLLLPRAETPAADEAAEATGPEPSRQAPLRVLVVDDDATVREVTAAFLAELGHRVLQSGDGPSALSLIEGGTRVDLVVADFAMPRMTGFELARALRARWPGLPVLLVTGFADLEKVPPLFPVLHKPYEMAELARRVAALAPQPAGVA